MFPPKLTNKVAQGAGSPVPKQLLLLGVAILAVGLNLRIGVASVGPVLGAIQQDLDVSESTAGLLVSIPVMSFGVFAFVTPALSRTLGSYRLLLLAVAVVAAGTFLRLSPSLLHLAASAVLIGGGVGVGNVLVPVIIKERFARNAATVTGLYVTLLFAGAALASGLTAPISRAAGGAWPLALGVWGVPAALACLVMALCFQPFLAEGSWRGRFANSRAQQIETSSVLGAPAARDGRVSSLLRQPTTWYVTGFMCLQSINYYVPLTWLPRLLADAGVPDEEAGWLLAFSAVPAICAALFTPLLVTVARSRVLPFVLSSIALIVALGGLLIAPVQGAAIWMVLLGGSQGSAITLSLCLLVWKAQDSEAASSLSTFAQGVGYMLASVSPFLVGMLLAKTTHWDLVLIVLLVGAVLQGGIGVIAIRSRSVQARV